MKSFKSLCQGFICKAARTIATGGTVAGLACSTAHAQRPAASSLLLQTAPVKLTLPAQLRYGFDTGKVYHYKVLAIFTGQIPKLSEPGTDANIKAELYYSATVLKQDAAGMSIAFAVEAENLSFLAKLPGPDGKINPDDELPFPLPLKQVQGFLNVTALLKPDGTIADVSGGNNQPIKIDVGVDLRKLFVLILPVVFPDQEIKVGSEWSFNEGFLGKKPGRTTYIGKLDSTRSDGAHSVFVLSQNAKSSVLDKIDSEGNSTADPKLQVGTITGNVTASGSMNFEVSAQSTVHASKAAAYKSRLSSGKMDLFVDLKRDMPDTEHAGKRLIDPITVKGHMVVTTQPGPPKTDASGAAATSQK